uniref:single-stranded DNA-binding protein n=1 Tax=Klebsiella pneumoniae TaxID=573 RepID=UPI001D19186A|nr:single-stranded DNA-binding protein [Klebsiella pneumoniae]
MNSPQNFYPKPGKNFAFCPGQVRQAVAVMPLAARVLKQVMVNTRGNKRQVPAKRQNCGSRNSTATVFCQEKIA